MRKKRFLAAVLVVPMIISGCKFGFQGSSGGSADNGESTVSFVDDGSPQSVLYKLQNACSAGDAVELAALLNLNFPVGGENDGDGQSDFSALLCALLHNLSISDIKVEYIEDIAGEAKLTANVTMLDIKQFAADNPDLFAMPDNAGGEKPADGDITENGERPDEGEMQSAIAEYAARLAAYDKTTVKEKLSLRFYYKDGKWELNGEMLLRMFLDDLQSVMPKPENEGENGRENEGENGGENGGEIELKE